MKINKLFFLFLILLLPFIAIKPVFAGFGISPGEIYNDTLKPGSRFETEIVLSRSESDEDLKIIIETELGETESWLKFEPSKEFIFPKGENRKNIKAIVEVPKDAQTKKYKGLIRIKASSIDAANSGVSIVQGARMEVNLITTSLNISALNIKSTRIPDVDSGKPIILYSNIENNGNVEIAPEKITLEIQRLNKDLVETQEVTKIEKISPNNTKEIAVEFKNNNLPSEEYFGIVKMFSEGKEIYSNRLVFKVVGGPINGNQEILKVNNNKIIFRHIGYGLIILVPIVVASIIRKKTDKKKLKKMYLLLTITYIIIAIISLYFYHQKHKSDMAKPGDIGNVQGESIEITPTTVPPIIDNSASLVVNKENNGYQIYRIPDLASEVVYTATENENLPVIDEKEGWFYVSTGKGTGGWLPKTSVKKVE